MIGLVAGALFFFLLLIAAVVVGMVLFAYASYCFLVVVNGTAAGANAVKWPNQPYIEWAGKFVYFAWLISFGLVPAVFIVWLVAPDLFEEPLGIVPVLAGVVWLVFPMLLLASLSNRHPMAIFHLGLMRRLLLRPASLAAFYVLTGVLLAGGVALGMIGLQRGALLIVAVPAGAALFLMYARLVGRLAWLLGYHTPLRTPKTTRKLHGKPPPAEYAGPILEQPPADAEDIPTASPPADSDEWTSNPYGFRGNQDPDPAAEMRTCFEPLPVPAAEEDEWQPHKKPVAVAASSEARRSDPPTKPDNQSLLWLASRKPQKQPAYPFFSGVFTFPWYETSLNAWVYLSLLGFLWSWIVVGMMAISPF